MRVRLPVIEGAVLPRSEGLLLLKLDANGAVIRQSTTPRATRARLAIDVDESILFAGRLDLVTSVDTGCSVIGLSGAVDHVAFAGKLDAAGNCLWDRRFVDYSQVHPLAPRIGPTGDVFLGIELPGDENDIHAWHAMRLDGATGAVKWTWLHGLLFHGPFRLAPDGTSTWLAAGSTTSTLIVLPP